MRDLAAATTLVNPDRASGTSTEEAGFVKRLLAGDEDAFVCLVERYHASLLRFARTFVTDQGVAEEVVQDTWLGVLKGLSSFEGRSALKSWIFSILANRAKSRAVREKRIITFSDLSSAASDDEQAVDPARFAGDGSWLAPPVPWKADTPETQLLRKEAVAAAVAAVDALPPSQRIVVTLRDVEGLDAAEVCSILELSETNQRVLLHRGRAKVRAALERYMSQR